MAEIMKVHLDVYTSLRAIKTCMTHGGIFLVQLFIIFEQRISIIKNNARH